MTRVALVLCGVLLLSSCTTRWSPDKALKPEGETVRVRLTDYVDYEGELLSVTDKGLVLDHLKKLSEVSFADVEHLLVQGYRVQFAKSDFERFINKLRVYARYPQGLTPEQWTQLLKHYGPDDFLRLAPGESK